MSMRFPMFGFSIIGLFQLMIIGLILAVVIGGILLLVAALTKKRQPTGPVMQPAERKKLLDEQETHFREERARVLDMVSSGQITPEEADRLIDSMHRQTATRACPFCAEEIQVQAVKCRHCGSMLVDYKSDRRLTRSNDSMLAGVCGGVAEYFDVDPTLIRVATALLVLFTSVIPGIIIYVVAAIILPPPA